MRWYTSKRFSRYFNITNITIIVMSEPLFIIEDLIGSIIMNTQIVSIKQ